MSREPGREGGWVGRPVPLKEDARLVAGRGRFVDDLDRPRMLHAAMLRSPHAHARIVSVHTREAEAVPGVFAVLTGTEAAARSGPIRPLLPTTAVVPDYCLAVDCVRYVGEAVAAVAAVDRATAEDALERIRVEYEPLSAVVDPEAAIAPDAPVLYPELGTNVVWHDTLTYGPVEEAVARADGVLRERFTIQRYASTPLETFGGIAEYDPGTDVFEFWTNDQRPGLTISSLAASLGVPQSRVRLSCPDIGGGFGNQRRPAHLLAARPQDWPAREVDRGPHREPDRAHARLQRDHGRGAGVSLRRHPAGTLGPRHRRRGQEPRHPDAAQPDQARQHRQRLSHPRGALRGLVGADQQVPERGQSRHRQAVHVLCHRAGDGLARAAARPGPGRFAPPQLRDRRADALHHAAGRALRQR